ncbi:TasA family protein [Dietzia sp. NPDC055343]
MTTLRRNLRRDYRWRESGWTRTRAALAMGMVFGLGAVGTMAQWSQTVTAQTGLFSTVDTVSLTIDGQPEKFEFEVDNLARGQSVARAFPLQNNGSTGFDYKVELLMADLTEQDGTGNQARSNAASLRENMTVSLHPGGTVDGATCSDPPFSTKSGPSHGPTSLRSGVQLPGETTHDYCIQAEIADNPPIASRMSRVGVTFKFTATAA